MLGIDFAWCPRMPNSAIDFPIRLAVASKEGRAISEHFGHARRFLIYDVSPTLCEQIDDRDVDHYCLGQQASQGAMEKILETVKDCHAVLVAKVGDGPRARLAAIGVGIVAGYAYEGIEDSLLDYAARLAAGEEPE